MNENEMTLSEFSDLCTASKIDDEWRVEFAWKKIDGEIVTLETATMTVYDCQSEYDAIEQVYLYLLDQIRNTNEKNKS